MPAGAVGVARIAFERGRCPWRALAKRPNLLRSRLYEQSISPLSGCWHLDIDRGTVESTRLSRGKKLSRMGCQSAHTYRQWMIGLSPAPQKQVVGSLWKKRGCWSPKVECTEKDLIYVKFAVQSAVCDSREIIICHLTSIRKDWYINRTFSAWSNYLKRYAPRNAY